MNYYKRRPYKYHDNGDAYYVYRIIENHPSYMRIKIVTSNLNFYKKGKIFMVSKEAHENDEKIPEWESVLLALE